MKLLTENGKKGLVQNLQDKYGEKFQKHLIKCFFEDEGFFMDTEHLVDQNLFGNEYMRTIVGTLKDLYLKNGTVPTYDVVEWKMTTNVSNNIRRESLVQTLKDIRDSDLRGMNDVEDMARSFFLRQNMVKAWMQIGSLLEKKDGKDDYVAISDIWQKAIEKCNRESDVYNIVENMEEALAPDIRRVIPTGARLIDRDFLRGGLGKGELGLIIAPTGVGKTSAMCGFACNAAITLSPENNNEGYKVLHIVFEDEPKMIKRKYYGYVTGYEAKDMGTKDVNEGVEDYFKNAHPEIYKLLQKNIMLKIPPTGEVSADQVKALLGKAKSQGFIPDLVLIDYFECLNIQSEYPKDTYEKEGVAMRKLENICKKFKVAMWVAIQGTKGAIVSEYMDLTQAGGSVKKVQIGHVIMGFSKTKEGKMHNLMNITLPKFRPGGNALDTIANIAFNNGTGRFGDVEGMTAATLPSQIESMQQKKDDMRFARSIARRP